MNAPPPLCSLSHFTTVTHPSAECDFPNGVVLEKQRAVDCLRAPHTRGLNIDLTALYTV